MRPALRTIRHVSRLAMAERAPAAHASEYKKRHVCLLFGFVGTGYYGLQSQSALGDAALPTVSDALRAALLECGGIAPTNMAPFTRTKWTLASRTDKGVHAARAAVSFRMETRPADGAAEAGAGGGSGWSLSAAERDALNAALPPSVRIFGASRVRKSFNAREDASSRTYEYLLPREALGDLSLQEFDSVLGTFEGVHRMHNFASGLRGAAPPAEHSHDGDAWPLALDPAHRNAKAFRSVFRCAVRKVVRVGGEEYVCVRVAGASFVLHQIRHMIGAAVAVARGVVDADVLSIALRSPLLVDAAPLAPACGLLLDRIEWFNHASGVNEVEFGADHDDAEAFKEQVIYRHIHERYEAVGGIGPWLAELADGDHAMRYTADELRRLRSVYAGWREMIDAKAAESSRRRREREAAEVAAEEAGAEAESEAAGGATDGDGAGGGKGGG